MDVQQFDTRVKESYRKENYRLVSVSEKVMYDQLYGTLCRHLSQNFSGFLKNHSCCTALLKITEDWRRSLDSIESQPWPWPLIYQRLLTLLNTIFCWQSWKPTVSLNLPRVWCHPIYWVVNRGFVCSVCSQVIQSWGRGFHRGPSINNVINDLNYAVPDVCLRLYADDTTLYVSDVLPISLQFVMNQGLSRHFSRLSEWFGANYLLISNAKTQAIPIGPCKYNFDVTLNGFWRYYTSLY